MLKLKKNKKGFTLVELMVVVVIIGILTAIAIPVYMNVTKTAKTNSCAANIDAIRSARSLIEANASMPDGAAAPTNSAGWTTAIQNQLEGGEWPVCPFGDEYDYVIADDGTVSHDHSEPSGSDSEPSGSE